MLLINIRNKSGDKWPPWGVTEGTGVVTEEKPCTLVNLNQLVK